MSNELYKEYKVLDKGFVRLVEYMGSDAAVVQAARVSYGDGTKTTREDEALINYLMRNRHTSPFEQVVFKFHLKMPIFIARQLVRHRTARLNEKSARYSVMTEEFHLPDAKDICGQSKSNKQCREKEAIEEAEYARSLMEISCKSSFATYTGLLEMGVARETAREVLPLSTYTEMYWQMDLHNLCHFISLRDHPHAQKEMRDYAAIMFMIASMVAPMSMSAFLKYNVDAVSLTKEEKDTLRCILVDTDNEYVKSIKDKLC